MRSLLRRALVVALPLLAVEIGCSSPPPAPPPPAASAPGTAAVESSVRPGINKEYRADPDPEHWRARFETESREIWSERARIVKWLALQPGMAVADVGAGTGFYSFLFAKEVGAKGTVYSEDIVPQFVEQIGKSAREKHLENVRAVLGKESSVELPAGSVDLAFVCDVYHHFEYPRSTLASIRRALRPRGELVVVDFVRIPGKSRPWVLEHVRAGEDVVTAEITAAGFEKVSEARFLKENYILRFRRKER